jgi:hypothetical protein
MILGLCERFHTVPSAIRSEEADIIRLIKIYHAGHRKEGDDDDGE